VTGPPGERQRLRAPLAATVLVQAHRRPPRKAQDCRHATVEPVDPAILEGTGRPAPAAASAPAARDTCAPPKHVGPRYLLQVPAMVAEEPPAAAAAELWVTESCVFVAPRQPCRPCKAAGVHPVAPGKFVGQHASCAAESGLLVAHARCCPSGAGIVPNGGRFGRSVEC
jgi:hypothetical protein